MREHMVFENRALRNMFGTKRDELKGGLEVTAQTGAS